MWKQIILKSIMKHDKVFFMYVFILFFGLDLHKPQ